MKRLILLSLVTILSVFLLTPYSYAIWDSLYETDFSTNPGWDTNNSSRYHWDSATQSFYTDNYTDSGNYATKTIDYNGESFRLKFDVKPVMQNWGYGDIDFGLFGPERKSHFYYGSSAERAFGFLGGYPWGNQMGLEGAGTAGTQVYLAPSPDQHIELNKWYHYDIQYDNLSKNVNFAVTKEGSADPLFSLSGAVSGGFSGNLDYLGASMNGDWVTSGREMVAYVDNVKMEIDVNRANPPENLPGPPYIGESRLEKLGNNPTDPSKPTIVITHGTDSNISAWADDMGNEIASRHPDYNVFGWDWSKYAIGKVHPNPFKPMGLETILSVADKEGEKLADHLEYWGYTDSLHLIGHSAGGTLIQRSAKDLENDGIQVTQLTFLDAPRLALFRDANFVDWADNYVSLWGSQWDGAYTYILNTPSHSYAHEFYEASISGEKGKAGFYWSKAGGGWYDPDKPSRSDIDFETTETTAPLPLMSTTKMEDNFNTIGSWYSSGNVSLINGMAFLKEASPAYLFEDLTIPFDANFLDFDFMFSNIGDGDYLTTHFNNNLLFWFYGQNFYGNDFWNSGLIDISPYSGHTGTLTFALNSVGNSNAELWIDNLHFSNVQPVPEPSSFILLGIGLLGIVNIIRKQKA